MHTAFLFLIFYIYGCLTGYLRGLKWASGPLELELQRVVIYMWLETKPWPSAMAESAGYQ